MQTNNERTLGLKTLEKKLDVELRKHYRASKDHASTVSESYYNDVRGTVRAFYRDTWAAGSEIKILENIRQEMIRDWISTKNTGDAKHSTLTKYCQRLQVWFGWIGKPELLPDPDAFVRGIPSTKRKKFRPSYHLKKSLVALLEEYNHKHATKNKLASKTTAKDRQRFMYRFSNDLYDLGHHLADINNLKQKHIVIWLLAVEKKKYAPGTLQRYGTYLRTLCRWLKKVNMMVEPRDVLMDPSGYQRTLVSNEDKTPTNPKATKSLEAVVEALRAECPQIADLVELSAAFGLRAEEAMKFAPILNDQGEYIDVRFGTKGGRPRKVSVDTEEQRVALQRIRAYAVSKYGTTIPKDKLFHQWENHIRYIFRKVGFTKKGCGFTLHSLRHAFANREYLIKTGILSCAQGGDLAGIDYEDDQRARGGVAEALGHSRTSITNVYLGSAVPKKRDASSSIDNG